MSPHQAHILPNNGATDMTIPLTNELSELILLLLKQKQIFSNSKSKDGMFRFTNISETLLYSGKLSNFL